MENWRFRERHLAAAQRFQHERSEALLAQFEEDDEKLVEAPFGSGYPGGASPARNRRSPLTARPPVAQTKSPNGGWPVPSTRCLDFPPSPDSAGPRPRRLSTPTGCQWTGARERPCQVAPVPDPRRRRGEDDDGDAAQDQQSITGFFGAKGAPPGASAQRCEFFQSRGISRVTSF